MRSLIRYLVLQLIVGYQRFVSPYKGFRCAYAHHTGRASCSRLGYCGIRMFGVERGLELLFGRFRRFRVEHERHLAIHHKQRSCPWTAAGSRAQQSGICDALACLPFDACFGAAVEGSLAGGAVDCCSAGCCDVGWPIEQAKNKAKRDCDRRAAALNDAQQRQRDRLIGLGRDH